MPAPTGEPVYVAADLLEGLCELAADREPEAVTVPLAVSSADDLEGAPVSDVPVFTHFYMPDASRSVRAVFGVDLGTPSGSTPGIFISHPDGRRALTKRDELRQVVLVAVPPWEPSGVVAYDRRGRRRPLRSLEVSIPEESPP